MDVDSALKSFRSGRVCTLCFSDDVEMEESQNAAELLLSCFCIQILQDPKLTTRICVHCSKRINDCQKFKNQCERSDTILKHLLYLENVRCNEDLKIDVPYKNEIDIEEHELKVESQIEVSSSKETSNNKEGNSTEIEPTVLNYEIHYNGTEIIVTPITPNNASMEMTVSVSPSNVVMPEYKAVLDEDTIDLTETEILNFTKRNPSVYNSEMQTSLRNTVETCDNTTASHCSTIQERLPDLASLLKEKHDAEICNAHKLQYCLLCSKENTDIRGTNHEKQPQKNKFRCRLCGTYFPTKPDVYVHMDIRHGDVQRTCRLCGRGFFTNENLAKHLEICGTKKTVLKEYKCNICGKICAGKGAIMSHKKTHNMPFKCTPCKKSFMTELQLLKHYKLHQRRNNCEFCGMDFDDVFQLVKHRSTHVY